MPEHCTQLCAYSNKGWALQMCRFKIGKGCFIGMKCYLDDLCVDEIIIGDNETISYGVYFACHGRKQGHNKIEI